MKKLKTIATSLMLGLFSNMVIAEQAPVTPQPVPAVEQPQVTINANSVNINTATASEIQDKLVGIGAKKAQSIVDYRTKNGTFTSIEQLKEVSGIGDAILEKNRERIILQ